jgi:RimJ/RimL family protein N-acetyltransferase
MTISDIDAVAGWFDSIDDVSFFDRNAVVPTPLDAVRESWKADLDPAASPPKAVWYIAEDRTGRPAAIGGLRIDQLYQRRCSAAGLRGPAPAGARCRIRLIAMLLDAAFTRLRLVRVTTYYREDNVISASDHPQGRFPRGGPVAQGAAGQWMPSRHGGGRNVAR